MPQMLSLLLENMDTEMGLFLPCNAMLARYMYDVAVCLSVLVLMTRLQVTNMLHGSLVIAELLVIYI